MNLVVSNLRRAPQYHLVRHLSVKAFFVNFSQVKEPKPVSPRIEEFRRKLRETAQFEKLEELTEHPYQEQEPLEPYPDNTNPVTGEVGGPKGPEPTRYGDWERKGKVSDF